MMDDLSDDEAEELLREVGIEARLLRERTETLDLAILALRIGGGKAGPRLVATDVLGDPEPLGEQVDQRRVEVVDARAVPLQLLVSHDEEPTGSAAVRPMPPRLQNDPSARMTDSLA
jgi:hypothetical protein